MTTGRSTAYLRQLTEKKTRSHALRTNDRDDGTGLGETAARGATTQQRIVSRCLPLRLRFNHNGAAAMRKLYNKSTYSDNEQHNGEAGMRGHDLYRQRLQHHTVGWELEGL